MCDYVTANFPPEVDQLVNKRVGKKYTSIRMNKLKNY